MLEQQGKWPRQVSSEVVAQSRLGRHLLCCSPHFNNNFIVRSLIMSCYRCVHDKANISAFLMPFWFNLFFLLKPFLCLSNSYVGFGVAHCISKDKIYGAVSRKAQAFVSHYILQILTCSHCVQTASGLLFYSPTTPWRLNTWHNKGVLCWVRQFNAIHSQKLMSKWLFSKTLNAWLPQHELLLLVGIIDCG